MWIRIRRHIFPRIFQKGIPIGRTAIRKRPRPVQPFLVLITVIALLVLGTTLVTVVKLWYSTMETMDMVAMTTTMKHSENTHDSVVNARTGPSRTATSSSSSSSALSPHATFQSQVNNNITNKVFPHHLWTFPPSNRFQNLSMEILNPLLEKGKGWDSSPIVLQKFRLVFFTTPKVGTTVLKQLFRRMMGHALWPLEDVNIPHNPQWNGLQYFYDFSLDQVRDMLTSPNWTRAIFVRDPLERLLSAYLDKAVRHNGTYVKRHCCGIKPDNSLSKAQVEQHVQEQQAQIRQHFQQQEPHHQQQKQQQQRPISRGMNLLLASSMSRQNGPPQQQQLPQPQRRQLQAMDMRVLNRIRSDAALQATLTSNKTPRPQSVPEGVPLPTVCANMTMDTPISWSTFVQDMINSCSDDPHWKTQVIPSLRWINFVGHFDSLQADTKRLLQQLGAWEKYGATGWSDYGDGGRPIFQQNTAQHKTSSREQMASYYANSTIRQTVLQFYHEDYENAILNLTRPTFD